LAEGVHWCPACDEAHVFHITTPNSNGARWAWDGNVEAPTFTPSMNIRVNFAPEDGGPIVCHYFLRAGRIEFLGDCSHALANQTVALPDWPGPP
jgi:hypothetical protein